MTLTVTGSIAFTTALQPAVDNINSVLGPRIKDAVVLAKPATAMPQRSDGGPSFGFWKPSLREIWMWEDIDEYPYVKTLGHEACHVLDEDWLTQDQRRDLMALMLPLPKRWYDQFIAGKKVKYKALPSECFAVYGSAALFGFKKPAYKSLFVRRVPETKWADLAAKSLADYGHAQPEPDPLPPIPTPPDPAQARIDELTALLNEISTDNADIAAQALTVSNKAKAEVPA